MADAFITRRGGGGATSKLQAKTITPTTAQQEVAPDTGYDGLSSVTVNPIPEAYIIPAGTKDITENGTVDVTSFAAVNVAVPAPDLSDATATTAKILLGATAYTGAGKITGTIPTYNGLIRPDDPTIPVKGDIITMDAKQYRVLKLNGTVAEVLCMYDANSSIQFDSASSGRNNTYAGKNIDTYCNNTFYSGLSSAMKSAIVDKTFTQDSWEYAYSVPTASHYTGKDDSNTTYYLTLANASFGASITRHCYCLSIQDVLDYLEATTSMGTSDTTLTATNIWQMFWNTTTSQKTIIWSRSAKNLDSRTIVEFSGYSGGFGGSWVEDSRAARPAFQIDLSKVEWTKQ